MTDVVVVGGGFAGLFTAVELVARGIEDVVVLEADEAPGGVARTVTVDGRQLEPAVGSLTLPHPHLTPILATLGVETVPAPAARVRHVWTGDRLVTIEPGPAAVAAPLVPWRSKLRAVGEILVPPDPDPDETLDVFMRRRFGSEAGRFAAWLAASGVYAGDPAELSADAAFSRLTALEQRSGSVVRGIVAAMRARPAGTPRRSLHTPVGGSAGIADAAARLLGDRLRTSTPVSGVRPVADGWEVDGIATKNVVLACDPQRTATILGVSPPADLLVDRPAAPVGVVWLGGPDDRFPLPEGFGILTGPDAGMLTRGVLLESSYAPHRSPAGHSLVKVIVGGRPERGLPPDVDLVDRVGHEVARILGHDIEADFAHVVHHRPGIPQYTAGHTAWLRSVDGATPRGLHLTGWGYRGVGIAHLATDAARVGATIGDNPDA